MGSRRQNNQLPNNLPQLQNLIKRDPESYHEEFEQQLRFFQSALSVFELQPTAYNKTLDESVMFLAQIARCYPKDLATLPQSLSDVLKKHATVLDPDMRLVFCRALILLRHKDLLAPSDLVTLFFELFKCQDKSLRKFLMDHIVNDVKAVNAKHKDVRLNTTLQNFMFKMLNDSHKSATKAALDILIDLYKRNVWKDKKTVNVISTACFHDMTKIMVTAVKFFLGKDEDEDGKDADSDDEADRLPAVKNTALANRVNKKSRKRERLLENLKKAHKRKKKKEKVEGYNFSALHLIHDPQGFAEKLFKRLDSLRERFEVKLLYLDLVSRLIGTHELFVLGYYSYIARFLNPHQREVVHMLQYAAQSAHELVPPDAIEPVVRVILNNFVTERNTSEVMAIGLNAMRELCKRCPLALDETTVRDLAGYKTYKDKAVMMAARSLIALYRMTYPHLLHKKDRGRPTEAQVELLSKRYGELVSTDYIPGAEELGVEVPENEEEEEGGDSDEEGWEDVNHSSDEEVEDEEEASEEEENDEKDENEGECSEDKSGEKIPKVVKVAGDSKPMSLDEKKKHAAEVTSSRILTDADFKRIDAAQLKKHVQAFRKGSSKRKHEEIDSSLAASWGRDELVDLANIEMIHKKRKHDKESRLATVMEGREGRDKFGSRKAKMNEFASSTHKEKARKKNFMMVKHKLKAKAKKSFTEKQRDLKKALIRSRKFK